MHRSLPLAVACLLMPLAAAAADPEWRTWNDGLRTAAASNRFIIVDAYTDWCGWCKRMDRDVYARAEISDYLRKRFVTIKLNAESNTAARYEGRNLTAAGVAQHFRVSGYPTTIFLRPNGDHMANVPGYVPADRFLLMLRFIGEDYISRGVKWSDFEKANAPPAGR